MKINGFTPNESIFNKSLNNIEKSEDVSFGTFLKDSLDKVNEKHLKSDELTKAFVSGENVDINDMLLSGEEAKISLQLAVQIRNKVVEAVQELTRMQL